jgi:hypothetical protein
VASLPEVDGVAVRARSLVPDSQRRIQFAGRNWIVKSAPHLEAGPGPNLWNDDPESVWVDAAGLHLRIVQRDGRWYSAEVFSEEYCGYGRYRFEVDAGVEHLDANAVFSGFLYDESGGEMDVEWSRWSNTANPANAQFVVQPDQVHPLALSLNGVPVVHEITWMEGGVDFDTRLASSNTPTSSLASWSVRNGVPTPAFTRLRFNLWLHGGAPPDTGAEIEVVVRSCELTTPTDVAADGTGARGRLATTSPVRRAKFAYQLELPSAGPVAVTLFDVRGRQIARLLQATLPAGSHALAWVAPSSRVTPGVYFLRADGPGLRQSRKLVLLP